MTKLIMTMMTILFVLSTGCNKTGPDIKATEISIGDNIYPLFFKKEKEFRFDVISKGPPIIAKIDAKDELFVYFLTNEDKNCEILRMTMDFDIKHRSIIKNGVGPGEATNPRIYGGDSRWIVVYDAPRYKFIKYDANFNLIGEYRVKDRGYFLYSGASYVPRHEFVLDGFSKALNFFERVDSIYLRKFTGKKNIEDVKIFETPIYQNIIKENRKMIVARHIHFGYFFGHIYILEKKDYRIIKMDTAGNVLLAKKIRFTPKSFPKSLRKEWIKIFYRGPKWVEEFDYPEELWPACWIIDLGEGIAVGRCENYDPEDKGPITADYFDPDLNYLGKIKIPYFSGWNHPSAGQIAVNRCLFNRDKRLYSLLERDEENRIIRWRIEIEKN
jgi:hypothetical protein